MIKTQDSKVLEIRNKFNTWLKSKSCVVTIFVFIILFIFSFFAPLFIEIINNMNIIDDSYYLFACNFLLAAYFLMFARKSILKDEEIEEDITKK